MTREEFNKRLCLIFCLLKTVSTEDILIAILKNDTQKLDEYRTAQTTCEQKINLYLTAWDNAPTPEEKAAVVASVTE
jgi:hypothetical protein